METLSKLSVSLKKKKSTCRAISIHYYRAKTNDAEIIETDKTEIEITAEIVKCPYPK